MRTAKILLLLASLFTHVELSAILRISNMNDFITTWSGSGNIILTDNVCIYDTNSVNRYRIRATGSGSGSAFTVTNGSSTVPYTVRFSGTVTPFTDLPVGVSVRFQSPDRVSSTCSGGTNATLEITFLETDMILADAGTYSGVLTLLLTS